MAILELFDWNFSTDIDKILSHDKFDKEIVSSLRKTKISGDVWKC